MKYPFLKRIFAALLILSFSTGANYLTLCLLSWEMNPNMWPYWVRILGSSMTAVSLGVAAAYLLPDWLSDALKSKPRENDIPITDKPATEQPEPISVFEQNRQKAKESTEQLEQAINNLHGTAKNLVTGLLEHAAKTRTPKTSRRKK